MSREMVVGRVRALYRYPIKSTAGEALETAEVTAQGLRHDRRWAAYTADGGIASGKRTRRFRAVPGLMAWQSSIAADEVPLLTSPAGRRYRADDPAASAALTAAFDESLTLRREGTVLHHDESPLHLLTTSSLAAAEALAGGAVDERRFRANIVVDTGSEPAFLEDDWVDAQLLIGGQVMLLVGPVMPRCVMIDQSQHGVSSTARVLRPLGAHHNTELGVQARAERLGVLCVGDVVTLRTPRRPSPS